MSSRYLIDPQALGGFGPGAQQQPLGALSQLFGASLFQSSFITPADPRPNTVKRFAGRLLSFAKPAVLKRVWIEQKTHECECGGDTIIDSYGFWKNVETAPATPEQRAANIVRLNLDERDAKVLARLLAHTDSDDTGAKDRRVGALSRIKLLLQQVGCFSTIQGSDYEPRTMFQDYTQPAKFGNPVA